MQASIDGSRTTLTRNLDALEDRGWIRTANTMCTITPAGQQLVDDFLDLVETMDVTMRFQEFFRWLSADEFDLELQALIDAELFTPEQGNPYAIINRHVEKIKESECQRGLLPVVGLHGLETVQERILDSAAELELIVEPHIVDTFRTAPEYNRVVSEMAATDRFQLYRYDGSIPFGLGLLDETVQIFADKQGEPRAMLETDAEQVQQWAERTFERYKTAASPVPIKTATTG